MNETIKFLREQNNLSQSAVAEYLGISRGMYIKYETGETDPSVKVIKTLCQLYKTDYETILDDRFSSKNRKNDYDSVNTEQCMYAASPEVAYGSKTINSYSGKNVRSEKNGGSSGVISELCLKKMKSLSSEQLHIISDLIDNLGNRSLSEKKEKTVIFGLAKGKYKIPEDIHQYDDEILAAFGDSL